MFVVPDGVVHLVNFAALPAAGAEIEEVVDLWKEARGTATAGSELPESGEQVRARAVSLRGAEANEAELKRRAPGQRVLHLATHGFFLGGSCHSALETSVTPSAAEKQGAAIVENPLLLSGLALAGANRRQEAGSQEEDGILTSEEIAALNLEGTELAVLSGCDTGVGEVKAGEGVLGLRRAFQVAGVQTLVMSLWPVEDEAAKAWITAYYRNHFRDGSGTAESVRQASLEVLRQRRAQHKSTNPFYWAGFVAAGDWHHGSSGGHRRGQ